MRKNTYAHWTWRSNYDNKYKDSDSLNKSYKFNLANNSNYYISSKNNKRNTSRCKS